MFDPLSSTSSIFAGDDDSTPPWPTTPHAPSTAIPGLRRAVSPVPPTPDKGPAAGIYGKEPQIYGQPEPGLISPRETVGSDGKMYEKPEPYLRVRITGLDRNRRDILVKLDAQTTLSNFTGTTYRNVSRSYIEFQQFYDAIIQSNPQTIIPALPLAQTSAPSDEEDDRLVKIMLQRWMTRVCEDPIILHDEDLRSFIESDFGYQPTPRPRRKTSSGFSLVRRGVPDEDEELQRARFELTKLEGQFFDTAKAIDKLAITRKSLAVAHAEMGNKLINVATTEAHPPLGNAFQKIGRAWHSVADLDQAQAISECVIIGDSLGYQGMNARSAKETLLQRTGVLEEYQAAVKTTISKRRHIERLKASSNIRPDRVDEALEEMEEANKYEQVLAKRAEGISQNLHRALQTHNRYANDDITTALIEHARSSIMYERQLLRELEALRPDVNNCANKVIPAANGVPRPPVIPPLEDFSRPPVRPESVPPSALRANTQANSFAKQGPLSAQPGRGPPNPFTGQGLPPSVTAPSTGPLSSSTPQLTRPGVGTLSQSQPNVQQGPLAPPQSPPLPPSQSSSRRDALSPLSSPGAGPSNSPRPTQKAFSTPPPDDEPPLGGRFVDGTKSMFVKPSSAPLSPPSTAPAIPGHLQRAQMAASMYTDPLSRTTADPLLGGVPRSAYGPNGYPRQEDAMDPLGQAKPAYMTSTMRPQPTRPKLDAREAASKLANMF
jgi:hypothetical protein